MKVEIEIPEGKEVKWINGVLTLVDGKPQKITERIKTFGDACNVLGDDHPFVKSYEKYVNTISEEGENDVIAYLKLRIICTALNEGWEPTFGADECRYYPCFYIYTKEDYEELDEYEKKACRVVGRSSSNSNASGGLVCAHAYNASSYSHSFNGSRLAFKTIELGEYCGKQFIDIWDDFLFG